MRQAALFAHSVPPAPRSFFPPCPLYMRTLDSPATSSHMLFDAKETSVSPFLGVWDLHFGSGTMSPARPISDITSGNKQGLKVASMAFDHGITLFPGQYSMPVTTSLICTQPDESRTLKEPFSPTCPHRILRRACPNEAPIQHGITPPTAVPNFEHAC